MVQERSTLARRSNPCHPCKNLTLASSPNEKCDFSEFLYRESEITDVAIQGLSQGFTFLSGLKSLTLNLMLLRNISDSPLTF